MKKIFLNTALLPGAVAPFLQLIAWYKLTGGLCDRVNIILFTSKIATAMYVYFLICYCH